MGLFDILIDILTGGGKENDGGDSYENDDCDTSGSCQGPY